MKDKIKVYFIATRPWSFILTFISVTGGALSAFIETGVFDVTLYLLTLIGVIALHASANLFNDYFDTVKGIDTPESPTAKYRPHPILTGMISADTLKSYALAMLILGLSIGVYLAMLKGLIVFVLGAIGGLLSISYSGPGGYKYKALGELAVFLVWGPIIFLGSYLVQTGFLSLYPVIVSIPVGMYVSAVLLANNLRDMKIDSESGIKTLPIVLGREKGLKLYETLILAPYMIVVLLVLAGITPIYTLLTLITIPEAIRLKRAFEKDIPPVADPMTAKLLQDFGLLYITGLFIPLVLPINFKPII